LALFSSSPLQVAYARSSRYAQAVQDICARRRFDVVHVEHLRGIASIDWIADTYPLVWDAVDCISLLWKHTMAAGPNLAVRTVALLEHNRTRRYEAKLLSLLKYIVVTSERDRQAMIDLRNLFTNDKMGRDERSLGDIGDIGVLPNGVDLEYFRPMQQERRRFNLVFSGKMSYHANVATALYLYHHIMPLIWQRRPEVTLTLAGSNPTKVIQRLGRDPRIEVTGYVDDMRSPVGRAEVMVSPMVYSVGIQNKVLEAMAVGTPVVVTAQAAAALSAEPGRDLLVADSAQEFADVALRLMDDAQLHATVCQAGRKYVEQQHDWRVVTQRLADVYERAIASHTAGLIKGKTYSTPSLVSGVQFYS
jgi:glycosyltransferase involved in cell wall biosynthesis